MRGGRGEECEPSGQHAERGASRQGRGGELSRTPATTTRSSRATHELKLTPVGGGWWWGVHQAGQLLVRELVETGFSCTHRLAVRKDRLLFVVEVLGGAVLTPQLRSRSVAVLHAA